MITQQETNIIRFKVAHYTKDSTFYEPTSQYGDLHILWNYQISCISSKLSGPRHWSFEPLTLSSNLLETFVKSYRNNFLNVIFSPKSYIWLAFFYIIGTKSIHFDLWNIILVKWSSNLKIIICHVVGCVRISWKEKEFSPIS